MVTGHLSIKVTVSPLGHNLFRSRADQFPRGASIGVGNDFELDLDSTVHGQSIREFIRSFGRHTVAPITELTRFGRELFERVFYGSVRERYVAVRDAARDRKLSFRICLSIQAPDLMALPWELLHDDSGFLIRDHGYAIVRVLDELQGTKSSFGHIQRVLVAAANPADGYDRFDAEAHLSELKVVLAKTHKTLEIVYPASRRGIRDALRSHHFDAFYFVGHGVHAANGGRLVCQRDGSEAAEELEAGVLAGWLRETDNLRIVYLNACSSAKADAASPFYGVAQRLMLDGNVAAVIAMPIEVPQAAALRMAQAFFEDLTRSSPEDAAMQMRATVDSELDWAIPTLYSYVDAPSQYERNQLAALMGGNASDEWELVVPSFFMGVPADDPPLKFDTAGHYVFPGETLARGDIESALSVRDLLVRVMSPAQITLVPQHEWRWQGKTNLVLFGSKSNPAVASVLQEFSKRFQFRYGHEEWVISDLERNQQYSMKSPHVLDPTVYNNTEDYGVIQKLASDGEPTKFVIAGLGVRATEGCGRYMLNSWRDLLDEFGQEPFAVVLRFPPGLGTKVLRVD